MNKTLFDGGVIGLWLVVRPLCTLLDRLQLWGPLGPSGQLVSGQLVRLDLVGLLPAVLTHQFIYGHDHCFDPWISDLIGWIPQISNSDWEICGSGKLGQN